MSSTVFMFSARRNAIAFWVGSIVVSAGVLLHLPMFWMARNSGFVLAGMAMDPGMLAGMALIIGGIVAAGYGLLPTVAPSEDTHELVTPPEDAPLHAAHWRLMGVLAVALIGSTADWSTRLTGVTRPRAVGGQRLRPRGVVTRGQGHAPCPNNPPTRTRFARPDVPSAT